MDAATIARDGGFSRPSGERLRPAIELLAVVGLMEAELWYLRSHAPTWLNLLVFGAILATLWLSYERRRRTGTPADAPSGLGRSWLEVSAAGLLLCVALVVAARLVGDPSETFEFLFLRKPPMKLLGWLVGKFGAALGQQLALQLFLWPACFEVTRRPWAGTFLAASIFAMAHLPSPTLVGITLLAGLVWIALYRRTGRLAPLVLCHMVLATLAHGALPERLTFDMRVGSAATADLKRFESLNDPKIRLANRRLKEHRESLIRFSSDEYYESRGGDLPGLIRGLYRDILGRPASDADVAFWVGRKLPNPRVDMTSMLLASDEYAQVLESRRANPDRAGVRR